MRWSQPSHLPGSPSRPLWDELRTCIYNLEVQVETIIKQGSSLGGTKDVTWERSAVLFKARSA